MAEAPGARDIQLMMDGGVPPAEVEAYRQRTNETLVKGGVPPLEIDRYWGATPVDTSRLKTAIDTNLATLTPDDKAKIAKDPMDLFKAGLQMSATGLVFGKPNIVAPEHMSLLDKIITGSGQMAGDLPAMVPGYAGGQALGAPIGAAVGGMLGPEGAAPGAAIGGAFGGGAGAAALPQAIREVLIDHYNHPDTPFAWNDVWARAATISMNTMKAGLLGGTANVLGGAVGGRVASAIGNQFVGGAANMTTQAVAATALGGALEGHVPTADDFVAGAVLAIGIHTAGSFVGAARRFVPTKDTEVVKKNMEELYAKTGLDPKMAAMASATDPALAQEVFAPRAADGSLVAPNLRRLSPGEPEPFKPEHMIEPEKPAPGQRLTVAAQVRGMDQGFNPKLYSIIDEAAKGLPPGWRAEIISAERPGATVAGTDNRSLHADASAMDIALIDPSGNRVANHGKGPGTSEYEVYKSFAQLARDAQAKLHPDLGEQFEWGGNFRTGKDAYDLMHFQIGGTRAMGNDAREPSARFTIQDAGTSEAGIRTYRINDNGQQTGMFALKMGDKSAEIVDVNTGAGPNSIGPREVRQFARQFFEQNPGIDEIHGQRMSGARVDTAQAGASVRITRDQVMGPAERMAKAEKIEPPDYIAMVHTLEGSGNNAVSPAGAIGRGQIMPDTARQYGFDADRLKEPEYNRMVTKAVTDDLAKKFGGNIPDMLVAYNAGPGRARSWIAGGRKMEDLPGETQRYLERAERLGFFDKGLNAAQNGRTLELQGDTREWVPPFGKQPDTTYLIEVPGGGGRGLGPPEEPPAGGSREEPLRLPKPPDPFELNEDMLADKIMDIVAPEAKTDGWPDWLNPRRLMSEFNAQLTPAKRLDRRMGIGTDEIGAEDMLRQTYASKERAGHFIRWGVLDPLNFQQISPANFIDAYKAVKEDGGSLKGYMAYRLAQRTVEKADQGVKTGVDLDTAKAYLSKTGDKYERGDAIMKEAKDGSINYARDSGLFSEDQAEAIKQLNREHIVMRRVSDDPNYNPPLPPGRSFGVRTPIRKMEGSDRQIVDPLTAEIDNLHTIIAMADRNRAIGHIISEVTNFERENRLNSQQFQQIKVYEKPEPKATGFVRDENGKPISDQWTDEEGHPIDPRAAAAAEILDTYRVANKGLGPNDFIWFNEGRMEHWRTSDPDLAAAMRMPAAAEPRLLVKGAIKFAGLARAGITADPSFPFRALTHAVLASSAFAEGKFRLPFHDVMSGMMDVIGETEAYKRWVANGGAGVALSDLDKNYVKADVQKVFEETGTANAVWNTFQHPIEAMRAAQHKVDAMARLGRFKSYEDQGFDSFQAAMKSRTAYQDYGEPLAWGALNTLSRMVPFFPSAWKDLQQVKDAFVNRPVRASLGALMGAGFVFTLPTIVNYAANMLADQKLEPKDQYSQLPRWMRDTYWVTPVFVDGVRFKIKKPYVGSVPFSILPERFLDYLAGQYGPTHDLWHSIVDQMVAPFIPTVLYPGMEAWTNRNMFTTEPLIPDRLAARSGYMQYTPATTETGKKLAQLLGPGGINVAPEEGGAASRWPGINPMVTDEFIRQWAGTLPFEALKIMESPWRPAHRPEGLAEMPFVKSFFARQDPHALQSVSDYHEEMRRFKAASANMKAAIEESDFSKITNYQVLESAVKLRDIDKAMQNFSAFLAATNRDPVMTDAEKRSNTDAAARGMLGTAQAGLAALKAILRSGVFSNRPEPIQ